MSLYFHSYNDPTPEEEADRLFVEQQFLTTLNHRRIIQLRRAAFKRKKESMNMFTIKGWTSLFEDLRWAFSTSLFGYKK